jgi:hypothetical protein
VQATVSVQGFDGVLLGLALGQRDYLADLLQGRPLRRTA